jgi:hypothetical protein
MTKGEAVMESVFAITHGKFTTWSERHRTHTIMGNGLTIEVDIAPDDKIYVRVAKGPEVVKALFGVWIRGKLSAIELSEALTNALLP